MNARAFRAEHQYLQRDVFLKVYDYVEGAAAEVLQEPRVLKEATTDPGSPHLVQIFEADIIAAGKDKVLCLQMEYVDGPSLLTELERGQVGQQDAVRLTTGILQGLLHLHSRNIVHRDLKPANILAVQGIARITDFGSARVLPGGSTSVAASKHSILYVPPEGFESPSRYSKKSDVYQVGVVLYELVNGPMVYDPSHYLLSADTKALEQGGKKYAELDDYEKTLLQNNGIHVLAKRRRLLEHGRPAAPYYSDRIRKIVRAATHPDEEQRIDASDFIQKLGQVSVPNWVRQPDGSFLCRNWHDRDWKVSHGQKGLRVLRSRPLEENYRQLKKLGAPATVAEAFDTIENL